METAEKLSTEKFVEWVNNQSEGKIFRVTFRKRSDNTVRTMTCRTRVRSHLAGGEKAFADADHKLLTVFDMGRGGYRSIPLEGLISCKLDGREYEIGTE